MLPPPPKPRLLRRLRGPLFALLLLSSIVIATVFILGPLKILSTVVQLVSFDRIRLLESYFSRMGKLLWMGWMGLLIQDVLGVEVVYRGLGNLDNHNSIGPNIGNSNCKSMSSKIENIFMISNHPSELDWMFLWLLGALPKLKIIMKDMGNVPFFGWACYYFGFVFLSRDDRERDMENIRKGILGQNYVAKPKGPSTGSTSSSDSDNNVNDAAAANTNSAAAVTVASSNPPNAPNSTNSNVKKPPQSSICLLMFPEGTDTHSGLEKSQTFAKSLGFPIWTEVCTPRTAGFVECCNIFKREGVPFHLIDVTIDYQGLTWQKESDSKSKVKRKVDPLDVFSGRNIPTRVVLDVHEIFAIDERGGMSRSWDAILGYEEEASNSIKDSGPSLRPAPGNLLEDDEYPEAVVKESDAAAVARLSVNSEAVKDSSGSCSGSDSESPTRPLIVQIDKHPPSTTSDNQITSNINPSSTFSYPEAAAESDTTPPSALKIDWVSLLLASRQAIRSSVRQKQTTTNARRRREERERKMILKRSKRQKVKTVMISAVARARRASVQRAVRAVSCEKDNNIPNYGGRHSSCSIGVRKSGRKSGSLSNITANDNGNRVSQTLSVQKEDSGESTEDSVTSSTRAAKAAARISNNCRNSITSQRVSVTVSQNRQSQQSQHSSGEKMVLEPLDDITNDDHNAPESSDSADPEVTVDIPFSNLDILVVPVPAERDPESPDSIPTFVLNLKSSQALNSGSDEALANTNKSTNQRNSNSAQSGENDANNVSSEPESVESDDHLESLTEAENADLMLEATVLSLYERKEKLLRALRGKSINAGESTNNFRTDFPFPGPLTPLSCQTLRSLFLRCSFYTFWTCVFALHFFLLYKRGLTKFVVCALSCTSLSIGVTVREETVGLKLLDLVLLVGMGLACFWLGNYEPVNYLCVGGGK